FNERKASATKASPKPTSMANNGPVQSLFSSNSSQTSLSSPDKSTTRQTPGLMNQHQPHATPTPSFNVNTTPTNKTSRTLMKGAKGSALLNKESSSGSQIPICYSCGIVIRGPFITAIGRTWCVDHFRCSKCTINLTECGFVEEKGKLYCELDFEKYLAPKCHKCHQAILKECCHALDKSWHPDCFVCTNCKKSISTGSFHVENGQPYCLEDFRRMFQSKCSNCDFAIEPGDPYVEVESLNGTYHVECFNCSICQTSLEGQLFIVKNNPSTLKALLDKSNLNEKEGHHSPSKLPNWLHVNGVSVDHPNNSHFYHSYQNQSYRATNGKQQTNTGGQGIYATTLMLLDQPDSIPVTNGTNNIMDMDPTPLDLLSQQHLEYPRQQYYSTQHKLLENTDIPKKMFIDRQIKKAKSLPGLLK
ncbi:unnamed protein product, partial [Didymodactylos carnosus]